MNNTALQQRIDIAKEAIKQAGKIIATDFYEGRNIEFRNEKSKNVSTNTDLHSEESIVKMLTKHFPHDAIITEESGRLGAEGDFLWAIDPLDGTSNFSMNIPYFGLCLSLQYQAKTQFTCIYNPLTHELAYAISGQGAFLNDKPVSLGKPAKTDNLVGFYIQGYGVTKQEEAEIYRVLIHSGKRVLNMWAPSLDWLALLHERADYIITYKTETEDFVPGAFIYEQAGGKIETWQQQPVLLDLHRDRIVTAIAAAPNTIHRIRSIANQIAEALQIENSKR